MGGGLCLQNSVFVGWGLGLVLDLCVCWLVVKGQMPFNSRDGASVGLFS